jgi:hypothetical protein
MCSRDLGASFRCNTQISNFANFTRDFLETVSDSGHAVKTKNALFFMNFTNFYKNSNLFPTGLGPLRGRGKCT